MRDWHYYYWKFFNVLGRVIGIGFILSGVIVCASGIGMLFTEIGSAEAWTMIVVSLIVVVLGALLLFAKPYRPKGPF